jgi:hypothetical protein
MSDSQDGLASALRVAALPATVSAARQVIDGNLVRPARDQMAALVRNIW